MRLYRKRVILFVCCLLVAAQARAQTVQSSIDETDIGPKPVDYGPGPGLPANGPAAAEQIPIGGTPEMVPPAVAGANVTGVFGPPLTWPIIPMHAVLLSDGRVLTYGSDTLGWQGAELVYDVWNPTDPVSPHLVLPNTTGTDIFCGAQSLLLGSGNALMAGGDMTLGAVRNFSNDRTTIFDAKNNGLIGTRPSMLYKRWYPTMVPLPNSEKLILGGREDKGTPVFTPEVYNEVSGWRTLYNATSAEAFSDPEKQWYYPRAYQLPNDPGGVFFLAHGGENYRIAPGGDGAITKYAEVAPIGDFRKPSLMYAPGKLLSVRKYQKAIAVDINGPQPVITPLPPVPSLRFWSNTTLLPNGKVLLSGGSAVANQLQGIAYDTQIWDPATGGWSPGASAGKPRLYHSIALLLPDGTVLTGGGGSPGPIKELNAEIYYPPYLFDAAGQPAPRPLLLAAPEALTMSLEPQFSAIVASGNQISRVTLVHNGSVTHSTDVEQRFQELSFTQSGQTLLINSPTNPNYIVPGYYMLFVFNYQGVPSQAKIVKIRG